MLKEKLVQYKRRYYTNQIIKGSILTLIFLSASFVTINFLEYVGEFNNLLRAALFFTFIASAAVSMVVWIAIPLSKLLVPKIQMSDDLAARQIGAYFPQVKDKLLNTLQLARLSQVETDLIVAGLQQKRAWFKPLNFGLSVRFGENKYYLRYLFPLLLLILFIFATLPEFFTESTSRIVYYNRQFVAQAPFHFNLLTSNLEVLKGDDLELKVELSGQAIPQEVFLVLKNRQIKMSKTKANQFAYTLEKLNSNQDFYFKASEYTSQSYQIIVNPDPNLVNFEVFLDYPNYTKKADENIGNNGHLIVPEGTKVTWNFFTQSVDLFRLKFGARIEKAQPSAKNNYRYTAALKKSQPYQVLLTNEFGRNRNVIEYYVNVVPDQYPSISLKYQYDTIVYDYLLLGGNITDDYGLTQLNLVYKIYNKHNKAKGDYQKLAIPFNKKALNQSYYHKVLLQDLGVEEGDRLEYYVEVYDNDGINGAKQSKTGLYNFQLPSAEKIEQQVKTSRQLAEKQFEDNLDETDKLRESMEDMEERIRGKKYLSWQDKKALEELLKESRQFNKSIQKLVEENKKYNQQRDRFSKQDQKLKEKSDKLEKMTKDLVSQEEKKLLDEIEKLLAESKNSEDIQKKLEELKRKQKNQRRNLRRALELFKRLKLESLLNDAKAQVGKITEEEKKLKSETDRTAPEKLAELAEKQAEIKKDYEKIEQKFEEIQKLDESLDRPQLENDFQAESDEVKSSMEESKKALEQKNQQKAQQKQQKTIEKLEELEQKMEQEQKSASIKQIQADYGDLKQILDNLLTLSFSEEKINNQFENIRQSNPLFTELSLEQLKLQQQSKLIVDSLLALANRSFELQSFIVKEVGKMENFMDKAIQATRQRKLNKILASQRYALTSINELALFLNRILENLLMQMSGGMAGQQMSEQRAKKMSLSESQKKLNQKLESLEKQQHEKGQSSSQKRKLGEDLAKIAVEQELIRQRLEQELEGAGGTEDHNKLLKDLIKTIEDSQKDLIDKQITKETIERQKDILTRLLKSEKADRERAKDNEREARTAQDYDPIAPQDILDDYLKEKEFQIELLKTIPTSLNRYYKQRVNKYLEKIH